MEITIEKVTASNIQLPAVNRSVFDTFVGIGNAGRANLFESYAHRIAFGAKNPWRVQSQTFLEVAMRIASETGAAKLQDVIDSLSFEALRAHIANPAITPETRYMLGEYTKTVLGFDKDQTFQMLAMTFHDYVAKPLREFLTAVIHGGDQIAGDMVACSVDWKAISASQYRARLAASQH
jgi:hypothetical protein